MSEHRVPTHSEQGPQYDVLKKPYARILIPEDDGTYSADILEFPGCHAEGDTPSEAISNLEEAAASWIEAALEQGQAIPPPMVVHGYSGNINLRLPKSIHKQAARFAARDRVSLNQFFASAIATRVGAEDFYERLVQRFPVPPLTITMNSQTVTYYNVPDRYVPLLQLQRTESVWENPRLTAEQSKVIHG